MYLFPNISKFPEKLVTDTLPSDFRGKAKKILYVSSVAVIFAALAVILYNNFQKYDALRTGDYEHHIQYLNHFLTSWRVPTANEGFQMYNPPVFYFLSAIFYRIFGQTHCFSSVERYAQFINSVSAFLTVLFVFLTLKKLIRDKLAIVLALGVAAFLPMQLYKAPSISGDNLAALFLGITIYLWLIYLSKPEKNVLIAMAVFSGIGLLVRYTALFPFLGICFGFVYVYYRRVLDRKKVLRDLIVFLSVVLAIAGVFYIRNILLFNKLFPINGTHDFFFFRQTPGYRDWGFYTNIFALALNSREFDSFLSSMYMTFWFDGQHLFLNYSNILKNELFSLLAMALLPTLLIILGIAKSLNSAVEQADKNSAFLIVSVATFWLFIVGVTLGSYQYPFYSILKAHYILPCIVPIICFLGLGLESWIARTGQLATSIWITVLSLMIYRLYYL
jgi:4-amino-4-deoxy-L-arabinose transferase-like glycosyltransferase